MFELLEPPESADPAEFLSDLRAAARDESKAVARRLGAIWQLYRVRLRQHGSAENLIFDTWNRVAAEVAAALNITLGLASSHVRYAHAMHERLPMVGMLLSAGDIDFRFLKAAVYRTELITDPDVLALVDNRLASRARAWMSLSEGRLSREIDRVVEKADTDAVRRRKDYVEEREVVISDADDGMATVFATLFGIDAQLLGQRLDALAGTVCPNDPRTAKQRRADALGVIGSGVERLACRCGRPDCAAADVPKREVVVHVIADQATIEGRSEAPGYLTGSEQLIPAEMVAELAAAAKLREVYIPIDAPPEPGYVPSAKLAEFVRCRDLTCRAPGCDVPASDCDIDHTVPWPVGPTHPSNLSCKCRTHHLAKTFSGWHDRQLPDGTLIWTLPDGQVHVTTPGGALLFPNLCAPTGKLDLPDADGPKRCGNRSALMPERRRTRAQNRAQRVEAERQDNRRKREARKQARKAELAELLSPKAPGPDDEPPPF